MVTTLTLDLIPEPMSAPQARAAIREFLTTAWIGADIESFTARIDDALLVTTELVSNAIRHGSGQVLLHAEADVVQGQPSVCLECHDDGEWIGSLSGHTPSATDPLEQIDDGGRGLLIIQALCSEVVVSHHQPGSRVRACIP